LTVFTKELNELMGRHSGSLQSIKLGPLVTTLFKNLDGQLLDFYLLAFKRLLKMLKQRLLR
tara:strand:- start:1163 stop:1345 length:183 start_codon:yes stop_codon:yes gene_type:complete